jgi:8-oxo-dGTP diphosphatase
MTHIHVVAAIIHHPDRQRILLARRPDHLHQGGLWEFPGGKVDAGEAARQALDRELAEELAIQVLRAEPFLEVRHQYPDKAVFLDVWQVWEFAGSPVGNEGQAIRWAELAALPEYSFPAANQPILDALLGR